MSKFDTDSLCLIEKDRYGDYLVAWNYPGMIDAYPLNYYVFLLTFKFGIRGFSSSASYLYKNS